MRGNKLSLVLALAAGALGVGVVASGCGENAVPDRPTYTHDIQPLLEAHCIRCHGAGGQGNADPDLPTFKIPGTTTTVSPTTKPNGNFTTYTGISAYSAGGLYAAVKNILPYMPPPPSDPLTDREFDTLNKWLSQTNPPEN